MDTAILAALIGAAATIASTWLGRWLPTPARRPAAPSPGRLAPAGQAGEPLPAVGGWRWACYLGWDVFRLSVRNVSVFALFVVLVVALQHLGVGRPTDLPPGRMPAARPGPPTQGQDTTQVLLALSGGAAAVGLGVAEALTRWSPWRRPQTPAPENA